VLESADDQQTRPSGGDSDAYAYGDVGESWETFSGMKSSQALGNVMYDSPTECIGFQSFL
jgi:hypothetical protein